MFAVSIIYRLIRIPTFVPCPGYTCWFFEAFPGNTSSSVVMQLFQLKREGPRDRLLFPHIRVDSRTRFVFQEQLLTGHAQRWCSKKFGIGIFQAKHCICSLSVPRSTTFVPDHFSAISHVFFGTKGCQCDPSCLSQKGTKNQITNSFVVPFDRPYALDRFNSGVFVEQRRGNDRRRCAGKHGVTPHPPRLFSAFSHEWNFISCTSFGQRFCGHPALTSAPSPPFCIAHNHQTSYFLRPNQVQVGPPISSSCRNHAVGVLSSPVQ